MQQTDATDIENDGSTDVDDLIAVILQWECGCAAGAAGECTADVNGSGCVDVDDLILVIVTWGPCE